MWPLSFWLPTAYRAATPPVAAIFAIMTKVGVYVVLRLSLLLFGAGAGESAQFGGDWLLYGGMARSEEHTSELQSLMRISYDVFCLKKNTTHTRQLTCSDNYLPIILN